MRVICLLHVLACDFHCWMLIKIDILILTLSSTSLEIESSMTLQLYNILTQLFLQTFPVSNNHLPLTTTHLVTSSHLYGDVTCQCLGDWPASKYLQVSPSPQPGGWQCWVRVSGSSVKLPEIFNPPSSGQETEKILLGVSLGDGSYSGNDQMSFKNIV